MTTPKGAISQGWARARRHGLAALGLCLGALCGLADPPTGEPRAWADWIEPDFPFFSAVLDARKVGAGFPEDNLTPRGLILNLGHDCWTCFDTDLLRVSAMWTGKAVTLVELAPVSYHEPEQLNFSYVHDVPTVYLPAPEGKVWLANGVYPGWQEREMRALTDPREPTPSPEEVGRGPLPTGMGRFRRLRLTRDGVVLQYSVGEAEIWESMMASEQGGTPCVERHFRVSPAKQTLLLILAGKPGGIAAGNNLSVSVVNVSAHAAAQALEDDKAWVVRLPAHSQPVEFVAAMAPGSTPIRIAPRTVSAESVPAGPPRWPELVTTRAALSPNTSAYVVDAIPLPLDNPWRRNIRVADIQFFRNGTAAAVTIDGDVWLIGGLKGDLQAVTWRRYASGFHEPLSLAIRDEQIYVFDRAGIWRLRDTRGSGEADEYDMFCNGFGQTAAVREHACSIKLAPDGSFVIAKGRGEPVATLGKDNGKVLRISADGTKVTTLGWGFRMPFIGVNPRTGLVTASDQEGFYVPTTPIYLLQKNEYHGYLDDFLPPEKYPAPIADPLTWIPHPVNPSAISQTWLTGARMGPLNDSLILVGYNRPELFRVILNQREPRTQAAVVSLTADFNFAPLNASVNPVDGQLYVAGFRIYGSTGAQVSGLARVRYTGAPSLLPREVVGMDKGILLRFDVALDPAAATNPDSYGIGRWNYKRSHNYGSAQYKLDGTLGQDRLVASGAYLSRDGKSVFVGLPDMKTGVWQMHVGWSLATREGGRLGGDAYFTPYVLTQFVPTAEGFGDIAIDLRPRQSAPPVAAPISAAEGQRLAGLLGCLACHTTNGTVGSANLAPTWKGLFGSQVALDDGTVCTASEAYLRDHILKRSGHYVRGFQNAMPNYSGIVSDAQIESLISYIKTLR